MEGKTRGGSTNQVTVTTQDGTKTEYTSREDVEAQIIKATEKKYHQTESGGCQFLTTEFREDFREFGEGPATKEVLDRYYAMPGNTPEATPANMQTAPPLYIPNYQ